MKALLILSDNVFLTPYLSFYINLLNRNNVQYCVLYWDKSGTELINDSRYIRFNYNKKGKLYRAYGYLKFRNKILSVIDNESFSLIIPMHGQVFALIVDKLVNNFRHRYIFDVRDYSYERFFIFRSCQKVLCHNSMINIISSPGYKKFLPRGKYWMCHNIPPSLCEGFKQLYSKNSIPIQISYIGSIRFMEQNKKIILFFLNDPRFHLNFIGLNALKLKDFCIKNNAKNVSLIDAFPSTKTLTYFQAADMIMNLYGNHVPLLDFALSNKLYYSAYLYKPILVCNDTYMEFICKKYHLGFSLSLVNPGEKDHLYQYYRTLDRSQYIRYCDNFFHNALNDNSDLNKKLDECLNLLKKEIADDKCT